MEPDRLVSVIIPMYNNAALASEAVRSALEQTYRRKEIVVVDDGSDDDPAPALAQFGDRILFLRQEHKGPAVARNAGIRASHGEFVAFLDSDDLWMPAKLERCVAVLEQRPAAGVVYTALTIFEMDTGRRYALPQYTLSGSMAQELFLECKGVNTSTLVVRRRCLDAVNLFDEDFFRAQDWDLMLRLAERFEYVHVPEALTERRLHDRSLSVVRSDLYARYNLMVIHKALARRPDLYGKLAADSLGRAHFRFAMEHYRNFQMKPARAEFMESLACRWNWTTFNYYLRAHLPAFAVRRLRKIRMAAGAKSGDKANG